MTESDFLATPARTGSPFAFARIRDGDDGPVPFLPGDGTKIRFASRAADTLTLTGLPRGFLASGDRVSVSYLGTTVFVGDVTRIVRRDGAGTDATDQVTCCGPWETMSRLVYRQNWATATGAELSSRLVLNQSSDGSAQSLDSELREIAGHGATPCGYSVGTVSVSSQCLPYDECRDITVADAIRRELRFFPRAVTRFNYSGETPSLSIVRVAADGADAEYIATIPKTERTYEITANPIDAGDLEIEETGDVQGVPYRKITHQKTAGDTSPVNPGCLYATLQIAGSSASTVRQTFKSVTEDIPANLTDASWWKQKHPRLAHVAASAITIVEASRSGEATKANYPRISAASAGELAEAGLRCRVEKFEAKVKIDAGADVEEELYLTMNFLTTNATGTAANPRKYTWTVESSSAAAETVPDGLAAAILADRSGSLRAARMTARLGSSLPQIGDLHQGLILQTFEVDCGDLTADLEFGAPEYLSPEDMASLLSGFRNKSRATCAASRISGKKADDGNAEVEMGGIPPLSSTEFEPGRKTKMTIGGSSSGSSASASSSITMDTTGGGGNVDVDTADIPQGETVAVKTLTITGAGANGADLTFKILSNDDVTINPGAARTPLSTTAPQDAVLSTGTASAGSSSEAAKSDHVHKLPDTVVDTVNDQTIEAVKTFRDGSSRHGYLVFDPSGQAEDKVYIRVWHVSNTFDMWVGPNDTSTSGTGNFLSLTKMPDGSRMLRLGTNVSNQQRLRASPTIDPNDSSSFTGDMQKQIATLGWVDAYYLGRLMVGNPTVTALSPGAQPTVTVTLSASTQGGKKDTLNFSFGIPGGEPGSPGPVNSITVSSRAISGGTAVTLTPDHGTPDTFAVMNGAAASLNKEFQLSGRKVADIAASANINVTQKTITGTSPINVSEDGDVITISLTSGAGGSLPSGYTGTRTILADVDYSSHNLRRRYVTETWTDGVLTNSVLGAWETYHTAVEETL